MRLGKAAVVVALTCWFVQCGVVTAQEAGGFEALLDDIGQEPAATDAAPAAPAAEPAAAPAAPVEPAAAEAAPAAMAEAPAEPAAPAPAEEPLMPAADETAIAPEAAPEEAAALPEAAEALDAGMPEAAEPAAEAAAPAEAVPVPEAAPEVAVEPAAEAAPVAAAEEAPAVEAAPVPAPAEPAKAEAKPPVSKKQAKELAAQEEVRRQAMEIQGIKSLELGYAAMGTSDFATALKHFEDALANLPERPANFEFRSRAKWGHAEADYRIALDLVRRRGNMADARTSCERALRMVPEHAGAAALLKKIAKQEMILAQPVPPSKRPDVVERKKTVAELLVEGKQYYELKDYNRAEAIFEKVLLEDEYNVDAMKFLRRIDEIRFKIATKERNATTAGMMYKVRDTWNPPIREEVELPQAVVAGGIVQAKSGAQRLQEKMSKIIIPSIEFRAANIADVINFLVEVSVKEDEEGTGVNIILNLNVPGAAGGAAPEAAAAPADEFGGMFDEGLPEAAGAPAAPQGVANIRTITLNLRRISLLDAIKYITEVAGLKYRLEDNAVIITPAGVVSGRVITRMYPVQPSILDVVVQTEESSGAGEERTGEFIEMGGGKTTIKRGDVKDFFEKAGVPFPVGTTITYNSSISQLIVANTPENLEIFERILAQINVIPNQVEIEARFVEVGENDLEELGLQWILTDNYEFAMKKGTAPLGGQERVQVNADSDGFTKGLRFFSVDGTTGAISPASTITQTANQSMLGGVLSVASVLTNPEVTVILQALSQHGNADLLSAPRVTTKTGVNAQIQVVREIIYPTEFEVTQPTVQSQGDLVTPPTVTPGSFETREVGVILNVTPQVGSDGYTIDLTMVPEVAELVDWIQYGSEITLETGAIGARQSRTFRYNIPQPVFSSRNATTSIIIWDGQTVVMGGLIREELVKVNDKIPFLGDIPVLGRLFKTEGQQSKKTNLLIFVTARLVDPAGKPIHKAGAGAMPGGSVQAQAAEAVAAP